MAAAEDSLLLPALARSQPFEHVAHAHMHKWRYSQPVLQGPLGASPPPVMQKTRLKGLFLKRHFLHNLHTLPASHLIKCIRSDENLPDPEGAAHITCGRDAQRSGR